MNESQALSILEKALKAADADDVVATLDGGTSAATRLADNRITQNLEATRATLVVTCAYGQSHGTATTEDLSDDAIQAAVKTAQAIAKSMPPDPEHMPPVEPAETAKYTKVNGYFEPTARFSPEARAKQLAAAAKTVSAKGYRLSGAYASGDGFTALANSAGLKAYHRSTRGEIHLTALGANGSGWAEKIGDNTDEIDVGAVAGEALRIAQLAQNPADPEAGKYTLIMPPAAVAEMVAFFLWMGFDAKAADEDRNFLRGKQGQKIAPETITVRSNPAEPGCLGRPFQDDGLASQTIKWLDKGVLKNLVYSRYWAKKQGKKATGWPANVIMDGGTTSIDQMIASTERGLLVTHFWYIRTVDPMRPLITGMTRDGLLRIENGKIADPVKQMRFNENPLDMLGRIEAMGPPGRTGEYMPMLMPALKVRDFNFTSTTKF
ncbi:MAG: TldD/PmbA family protein [Verrucomicrobia bacterium]|nr:TldD/PmbA family protein [Verrucomicrobiota bacterium]